MVYDPIRDCDVPSPATSMHNPSPWNDVTPGSEARHTPSAYPPNFQHDRHDRHSPGALQTPGNLSRSMSGGLRGLLNDDGPESRRSSGRDSFSSAGYEETPQGPPRSRITHLVHENATPLSQSSSQSSMGQSGMSHQSHPSPASKPYSLLDHDGFLAPVTPASAYPRPSRSPYSLNSPSGYPHAPLPNVENGMTRSPYPHSHDQLPLRSPSISVSPRQHLQSLPIAHHPQSRPGSSSSAGGFAFATPYESPSIYQRQLSADYTSRPRSGSKTATGPSSRRPSTGAAYQPQRAPPPRSPSPPPRLPYAPHHRISQPTTLLSPLPREDMEQFKAAGMSNNPLRRAAQRPPPSWSGPSPSPSLRQTSASNETENSYFPPNNHSDRRIASDSPGPSAPKKRKTSDRHSKEREGPNSNGGSVSRQKLEDKRYMGNVGLVADHCKSEHHAAVGRRRSQY